MNVLRLTDLIAQGALAGKRVFIRADLNVPQDERGAITEDTRIRASVPAIRLALDAGAAVMVTSHLGRPTEGEFKPEDSLAPVAARLSELLGREVPLVANWVDGVTAAPGQVVLLENCRLNVGEKKNKEDLAAACFLRGIDRYNGLIAQAEGGPDVRARVKQFLDAYFEYRARMLAGEVEPLTAFNDVRALNSAPVNAAYVDMFRRIRTLLSGPSHSSAIRSPLAVSNAIRLNSGLPVRSVEPITAISPL